MAKKFLSKVLLYNLLIAVAVVVLLLFIVQAGLKSYTRHGQAVPVPDLRGMDLEKVKTVLSEQDLEWQVMDSVFDMKRPPLSVVEQNPKAGSKVKEGRTIYLTINASTAPTTEIPDLIGRSSLKYAKMQLESYGLKVGEPIYRPDPHLNAVIGMQVNGRNVTKKMRVPKGTEVILLVGDGLGSGSRISVPYLIGLRFEEAEFKLKGYSLNVGAQVVEDGVEDTLGAVVYRQAPAYGQGNYIRLGESIDLFLSKELPEGIVVDPTLYDKLDTVTTEK